MNLQKVQKQDRDEKLYNKSEQNSTTQKLYNTTPLRKDGSLLSGLQCSSPCSLCSLCCVQSELGMQVHCIGSQRGGRQRGGHRRSIMRQCCRVFNRVVELQSLCLKFLQSFSRPNLVFVRFTGPNEVSSETFSPTKSTHL